MQWTRTIHPAPATSGELISAGAMGAQLLNDGRVLLFGYFGARIVTPRSDGSYANAHISDWFPYLTGGGGGQNGGVITIHPNGEVAKMGGHGVFFDGGANMAHIFDPKLNRFTKTFTGQSALSHEAGGGIGWHPVLNKVGRMPLTSIVCYDEQADQIVTVNVGSGLQFLTEAGCVQLPDDSIIAFQYAQPEATFQVPRRDSSGNSTAPVTVTRPTATHARAWQWDAHEWGANFPHYLHPFNAPGAEWGGAIWMPKIQRVVIVGGDCSLWLYDPATNTLTNPTCAPVDDMHLRTPFGLRATLAPAHNGQTVAQLLASTAIAATVTSGSINSARFCVRTNNGRAVAIRANGGYRINGGSTIGVDTPTSNISPGATVEFLPPFTQTLGTTTGNFSTGNAVSTVWFHPVSAEAWVAITPNGDLMFSLDYCECNGGIWSQATANFAVWDGTNWTIENTGFGVGNNSNSQHAVALPSGEMGVFSGGQQYISESIPTASPFAPTIVSSPAAAVLGTTFTLEGRQLHGQHQGELFGDENTAWCNHPIIRLTHKTDGTVRYCPTTNWTTRSIKPNLLSSCTVEIPANIPPGEYTMQVVSAGNASMGMDFTVMEPPRPSLTTVQGFQ